MRKIKLLVLCFVCLLVVGCASKESKEVGTLDSFQSAAINNGFNTSDKLEEYKSQNANYITGAIQATLDDVTVEMVIYDTVENAEKIQKQHVKSFLGMKSTAAASKKDEGKNYYKFSMISNGYYMVSSRIDNTVIFSKTQLPNKEKVEAILNEINY